MRAPAIRTLAITAGTLCVLVFLLGKTKVGGVGEHERYMNLLVQLQKVDSALDSELLEARYSHLLNYDPFVKDVLDLRAGAEGLRDLPRFLESGSAGRAQLAESIAELLRLLAVKEVLVDRFKSENATLRNALSFFPVATSELAEAALPRDRRLALELQALLRDVLMYNLHSNEEILPRIQARIEDLSAQGRSLPEGARREDLERVLNHAHTILESKTLLDGITRQALDQRTQQLLQRIQAAYWGQYVQMVSVTNNYRLGLYLFAIFLMTLAAYSVLRLKNAAAALNEANLTLERRVEERTRDLHQANRDLAERQIQLSLAQGATAQSERMASLGTLAAGVAHEINNPLAYILSNLKFVSTELGEVEGKVPPGWLADVRQVLGDAQDGAERVRSIVHDLHTFSRAPQPLGPVDIHRLLDQTVNIASNEIRYRAALAKDYGGPLEVHGNEHRLGQVFLNLVLNAAQAIPEGKPGENEIRITTRAEGVDRVAVEIRDTGCGIPPDLQARVFEPFFTTKEPGKGTGLGLSICHGIVTALGGEIALESDVGKGSTFRVVLPGATERSSPPVPTAEAGLKRVG